MCFTKSVQHYLLLPSSPLKGLLRYPKDADLKFPRNTPADKFNEVNFMVKHRVVILLTKKLAGCP